MDKLKELFENAVLTDETKQAVQEAFDAKVKEIEESKEIQFAEKLVEAKNQFAEEMVSIIREAVESEISDLHEEIEHARTLEEQYAEKLVDFKQKYHEKAAEKLEEAITARMDKEMEELKDEIQEAKENKLGRKIFEAFKEEIVASGVIAESEIVDGETLKSDLKESKEEVARLTRELKMKEILESVSKDKKEVVETILEGVETEKLEARFEKLMESMSKEEKDKEHLEENENEKEEDQLDENARVISEVKLTDEERKNKYSDYRLRARIAAGLE